MDRNMLRGMLTTLNTSVMVVQIGMVLVEECLVHWLQLLNIQTIDINESVLSNWNA